jgi:hypothetical protein
MTENRKNDFFRYVYDDDIENEDDVDSFLNNDTHSITNEYKVLKFLNRVNFHKN